MSRTHKHLPHFGWAAWAALVFLYMPVVGVIVFSFNTGRLITVWEGFGTNWYAAALTNKDLHRAAINSVIVATGAAIISTLLALAAALALHNKRNAARVQGLIMMPLLVPEIVMAVASMSFFGAIGLTLGIGNIMIAHIVFCLPFAYLPIMARLKTVPAPLFEAAADLYASPWQTFHHITLPLLGPGIFSGLLLAFITSLDDFIITEMVAPPGAMTLPVYIHSMVRRGITPEINAAAAILLAVSMGFVVSSYILHRKQLPGESS